MLLREPNSENGFGKIVSSVFMVFRGESYGWSRCGRENRTIVWGICHVTGVAHVNLLGQRWLPPTTVNIPGLFLLFPSTLVACKAHVILENTKHVCLCSLGNILVFLTAVLLLVHTFRHRCVNFVCNAFSRNSRREKPVRSLACILSFYTVKDIIVRTL